jgi:hypothetical protein
MRGLKASAALEIVNFGRAIDKKDSAPGFAAGHCGGHFFT